MTEIALLADIHGNKPALDVVAQDLAQRSIEQIYCLGDVCGRGPLGSYTFDWCMEHCQVFLQGNWEEFMLNGFGPHYVENDLGRERLAKMKQLPFYHKFWLSGRRVHLFHGRPVYPGVLMPEDSAEDKKRMFTVVADEFPPDIVGYADIHRQLKHDLQDDPRVLFNTGSIGNSYSTANAHYVILRGELDAREKAPFSMEFVSLPYDNQEAVRLAWEQSHWFDAKTYEEEVTQGTWHMLR